MHDFPGKWACRRDWLDALELELAKACDIARVHRAHALVKQIDHARADAARIRADLP